MAAYRAEIEIGVRGIRQLQDTTKQIDLLSKGVDGVNKRFSGAIQSLNAYNTNLARAAATLNKVNAGTVAEAEAVKQYVTALGQANAARDRQNKLIQEQIRLQRKITPTANAGFGVQGPALPPSRSQQGKGKDIAGNAIIGGAFPLLFGQGLGASVGGGLGGALGGAMGGNLGFGLSLVGTAVGSAFDQVIVSAQDFAKSLREGGNAAGYLENKLGILDPTIKKQISNLQNSGQTAAAAELAFDQLAQQLGEDGARAFLEAGKNTDSLSRSLKLVIDRFVAAGFAANKYFEELKYGKGGSFTDFLPPQLRPAPAPQTPATTSAFKERSAELGRETEALRVQLELTSVSAKTELDRYVTLSRSAAQKEYENRLAEIAIQLKNKEISLEQNKQLITNANLQLAIKLGEIERSRIQEVQRRNQEAAQAAERAARAAEQAAKEQTRAYQESLRLQNELSQTVLEEYSNLTRDVNEYKGIIAGYEKLNILLDKRLPIQEEILNYERAIARTSDAYAANQGAIEAIHDVRLSNLRREHEYLKANLTIQKERAVLEQTAAMTKLARQNNQRRVTGQTEIDRLTTQLESPFGGEQVEKQMLLLDQYTRRMDELLPIQQSIQDLQKDIEAAVQTPGVFTEDQVNAKKAELAIQTDQLNQLQAELQIRDRLEQQLLRQQEIYKRYGFIADEVSRALSDSISGLITGTTTVSEAFGRMFDNIAKAFLDMATQLLAQKLLLTLFNYVFSGINGQGLEATTPRGNAAFMDRVFSTPLAGAPSALPGRAGGGPVSAGSPYMVGEKGPELFVPGRSGTVVPNSALGGDNVNVVVNVDAKGTRVQGNDQTGTQLGRAISAAVQAELVRQKRPGGLLT